MKLQARVTSLRTGGRMEITIVTSATGLEQAITADNGEGYALDEPLVVLVMRQGDSDLLYQAVTERNFGDVLVDELAHDLADQLRPDAPPPFLDADADSPQLWELPREQEPAPLRCGAAVALSIGDWARCSLQAGHSELHSYVTQPTEAQAGMEVVES